MTSLGHAAVSDRHPEWRTTLDEFKTGDEAMRLCLDLARMAAKTDLPILILGETGTGKTLLARVVHNSSRRAHGPFVAFNSAAISDTLLDSQLFGHERGAFTGAERRVKGKFELADGGTLFLDEIADMSPAAQAKILRAVEHGEFERLGSDQLLEADVRLISATHLPINRYKETDHFRKDLFYRISGITLKVPALRERPNDLRALVATEIAAAGAALGRSIAGLSRSAAERIFDYEWPGNLRELKRVIHTAVALTEGEVIEESVLLLEAVEAGGPAPAPAVTATDNSSSHSAPDLSLRAGQRARWAWPAAHSIGSSAKPDEARSEGRAEPAAESGRMVRKSDPRTECRLRPLPQVVPDSPLASLGQAGPPLALGTNQVKPNGSDPAAHTLQEGAMPNKKKIADLPKKAMNTKKTEAVKGGRKLNISARLRKPY